MTGDQLIRDRALGYALAMEQSLPHPLTWRTDDLSPGDEITEHDTAVMNERAGLAEQAIADRVLRHARLFSEYIRSGFDSDGELAELAEAAEPPSWPSDHPDRHGGG